MLFPLRAQSPGAAAAPSRNALPSKLSSGTSFTSSSRQFSLSSSVQALFLAASIAAPPHPGTDQHRLNHHLSSGPQSLRHCLGLQFHHGILLEYPLTPPLMTSPFRRRM